MSSQPRRLHVWDSPGRGLQQQERTAKASLSCSAAGWFGPPVLPCMPVVSARPLLAACLLTAAIDTNANGTVERSEFADFIFHLAVAELKSTQAASLSELED